MLASSDQDAAEGAGIAAQTVYNWKSVDPEFLAEYNGLFLDVMRLAQEYTRGLLGKVATVLDHALEATGEDGPDWRTKLEAAKLILQVHSLLRQRVDVNIREEASRVAAELGLDSAEVLAEAERVMAGK